MTRPGWTLNGAPWLGGSSERPVRRARVVVDNDFAGDPDGLFQLAHHVLSSSVEIRAVIGSHLVAGEHPDPRVDTAALAVERVHELFGVMGLDAEGHVHRGSREALVSRDEPHDTPAARAIVAEAMREDDRPLYVTCGGGLTDLASAWLLEPAIARRLTVVWIGGPEHPGLASPWPGPGDPEYNLAVDVTAAQVVFNDSDLPLWVVPRDMYRQCLVSDTELRRRVAPRGDLGRHLYDAVDRFARRTGAPPAETYALGDSPLVLLTALQSFFGADASSSDFSEVSAPGLDGRGALVPRSDGRRIRVFTRMDTRLMFEDMFLKIEAFAEWRDH